MKGVLVVLVASIAALAATSAHATIDTCLMVRNTPDGFLALREGPGTQCKVKARLKPGELLIADVETTAGQ